jgi:NADH:ubiquinone oxidoreductase subunit 4 (subunit M)
VLINRNVSVIARTQGHKRSAAIASFYTQARSHLGVDGFSFPMVLLATLLYFLAILASGSITGGVKGYYALMLVLEAAVLRMFRRAFLGPTGNTIVRQAVHLRTRELSLLGLLAMLILLLGVWRGSVLELTRLAAEG